MMRQILRLLAALAGLAASGGELLTNPGFDLDADGNGLPDGWNCSSGQVAWRELAYMSHNYAVISRPPTYVMATQGVRLVKGKEYTVRVRCRTEGGGMAGVLILHGEERPHREMSLLWNLRSDGEFLEQARTFTAPNPVCQVYIYNLGRDKGKATYDLVSLTEGRPDHTTISQLSFREIDRPLGGPVVTPHTAWARPLAGGPLQAFITLRNIRCLREVVELGQRIELDADVVHTGFRGGACVSQTATRAMERLRAESYEVYVVPSRVNEVLAKDIRERVEAGAGLVVVEGFGQMASFLDPKALQPAADDHPLRGVFPMDRMPERVALTDIEVGRLGKGRVVRLRFDYALFRMWGLVPTPNAPQREVYLSRQFSYWEWWYALLAESARWAARGETKVKVVGAELAGNEVRVRASGAPTGSRLRVVLRSSREIRWGEPGFVTSMREIPLADGRASLALPQGWPAGETFVETSVRNAEGGALTWRASSVTTPQTARFAELQVEEDTGTLTRVRVVGKADGPAMLLVRMVDPLGRVLAEQEQALARGEFEERIELRPSAPLTVGVRVEARLQAGGREQDRLWRLLYRPAGARQQAARDFVAMPWGPGMCHPAIRQDYAKVTHGLGLNAEFAQVPALIADSGMFGGGYIGGLGMFREDKHLPGGIRRRCLNDPEIQEEMVAKTTERAQQQGQDGYFAVGITDEAFLSSRHQRTELCFCEHCQKAFQEWLHRKYGDLAALNRSWDTDHKTWDAVRGMRTEEARGRGNYAPFVDFRTFMTDTWIESCARVTRAYHEAAPEIPVGHTNTFGSNPFNGNDYWKLATRTGFGWGQEYSEAIKPTAHKAVFDIWRSFVETPEARRSRGTDAPFFNYGWIGYAHRADAAAYEPWWLALHGSRGVSYFATNAVDAERGVSWALVFPDLRPTPYGQAVAESLRDLRAGCGKLLMEFERETPRIAILLSHPSMLVSWCESKGDLPVPEEGVGADAYGTHFKSALNIRQHLNELQLDYQYVAPEQVLKGNVLDEFPLLFLPFTVAASPALVAKLTEYVRAGGMVVTDLRALRTDAHGRPADPGILRDLFGVARADAGGMTYGESLVTGTGGDDLLGLPKLVFPVRAREALQAAGAEVLARHASGELAVATKAHGKGLTVYLNFVLPDYDVGARELVAALVKRAGVARRVRVEATVGGVPRAWELNTFRRGALAVRGFIRDHRRCEDSDPVRLQFADSAHTYDIRKGEYLGQVASVGTSLAPGNTLLLARLPYKVGSVVVKAPQKASQGEVIPVALRVLAGDAKPGDHVVRLEVRGPGGSGTWHNQSVVAVAGKVTLQLPLARNAAVGGWRVTVRDVLTGASGVAKFQVVR
jgi:beta-galactosidase GanA